MSETLGILQEGIEELFPEAEEMDINPETALQEIPDWDSMSSVNLQSFLEQTFDISVAQEILADDLTIGELIDMIENPEKIGEAA